MGSYKIHATTLPQPFILTTLERLAEKHVKVTLLVEDRLTFMEILNPNGVPVDSLKAYQNTGVRVVTINPKSEYTQSHIKVAIIDNSAALVGNTNFDKCPKGNPERPPSRDFALRIDDLSVVRELKKGFLADLNGTTFEASHPSIIWGPHRQREKFLKMIRNAKEHIRIYQQDLSDCAIALALCHQAKEGIKVEVVMSPFPFGKGKPDHNVFNQLLITASGGTVYLNDALNIHAKVLLVDDQVYIGSTNFFKNSLEQNRNVGIIVSNPSIVRRVNQIFEHDISQSKIFCLPEP